MKRPLRVAMAGGGTGGHVIPALAVAEQLRRRGHEPFFIGTERGYEGRLVPEAGFPIEWIEIGGFNRVSLEQRLRTLWQAPASLLRARSLLKARRADAVFSMGGYVAAPVMGAALLCGVPVVVMEPNAIPGMVNRKMGRWVRRALINFPEAADHFPAGRSETTGVPVRQAFFEIGPPPEGKFTLLVTGGSQGSRTLNEAVRAAWPRFAEVRDSIRIIHQCGKRWEAELQPQFAATGLEGCVTAFLPDMPRAFGEAHLLVSRAGASTVSEIAAAGRAAILVPFPFAADNHQLRNAEGFARTGGGMLIEDKDLTGERLFHEVMRLAADRNELRRMGAAARALAHPDAAEKAARIVEEVAG